MLLKVYNLVNMTNMSRESFNFEWEFEARSTLAATMIINPRTFLLWLDKTYLFCSNKL